MKPHKGIVLALMLALGACVLGFGALVYDNQLAVGIQSSVLEPAGEFELAYTPHDAIWIQNNQELIDQVDVESWLGDGSSQSPFMITGYSFNQDTQPFRIWNTDLFWIFTGNLVDSDGAGMQCGTWLDNVTNGAIVDNIFRNRHSGLYILDAENVNITDNNIYSNIGYGMEFGSTIRSCNVSYNRVHNCHDGGIRIPMGVYDSEIVGNNITDCGGTGIYLMGTVKNSVVSMNTVDASGADGMMMSLIDESIISFNSIINSTDAGIHILNGKSGQITNNTVIEAGDEGFIVTACDSLSFEYNTIRSCDGVGFKVDSGENASICWNTIEDNSGYGLELGADTVTYTIRYNTFLGNGGTCQVCDNGNTNDIRLNYYSDWTSPDADTDGIVDTPYEVDGDALNADPYPLAEAGVVPETEPTTTPTGQPGQIPMDVILLGAGAVVAIVIITGAVMLKKR